MNIIPATARGNNRVWALLRPLALVSLIALALPYALTVRRSALAGSVPALLDLVPADSTVIAYGDLAMLRNSPLAQYIGSAARPPSVDRDYADFVRATGFDYQKDLDRVVLAVRTAAVPQVLVFADGRFDAVKIQAYALRTGKLDNQNGHAIYVVPSSTKGKNVSIVFLAPGRIALSDGAEALSRDFSQPASPALDQALRDRISRVSGSPIFAVAKASSFNNASPNRAVSSSPLSSLQWISFAARPDGGSVILSAEGECDTPEQAQKAAVALDLFRGLMHSGLLNPKARGQMPAATAAAADRLLQGVQVTAEAARVRLLVTVTPDMLATLAPSK